MIPDSFAVSTMNMMIPKKIIYDDDFTYYDFTVSFEHTHTLLRRNVSTGAYSSCTP